VLKIQAILLLLMSISKLLRKKEYCMIITSVLSVEYTHRSRELRSRGVPRLLGLERGRRVGGMKGSGVEFAFVSSVRTRQTGRPEA
jgi:hypothetical protein